MIAFRASTGTLAAAIRHEGNEHPARQVEPASSVAARLNAWQGKSMELPNIALDRRRPVFVGISRWRRGERAMADFRAARLRAP